MILPDPHIDELEKIINEKALLSDFECKKFHLRKMPPTLHRQLKILASSVSINMEDLIYLAVKVYIDIVREFAAKELEESLGQTEQEQKREKEIQEKQKATLKI